MTIKESIKVAIQKKDYKRIGKNVNYLRFRFGMNAKEIFELINKETGISLGEWSDIMQEVEHYEQFHQTE